MRNINKEDLQKATETSNSYSDLCCYFDYSQNGKRIKYFKNLIEKYKISTDHWDWRKKTRKYEWIEKECPICGKKFTTQKGIKGEKTTCSVGCSNTFFHRHTEESKEKIRQSIYGYCKKVGKNIRTRIKIDGKVRILYIPNIKIICKQCGKEKLTTKPTQKFCSNKCASISNSKNPEYIEKLKKAQQKRVKEGRHKGWKTRNILSYPEEFFIKVLDNNKITYKVNKYFKGYFLDFAIEEKMIDLEIDGKQHQYEDRKEHDIKRDKFLKENGWIVYRIDWNSINTEEGSLLMKDKIDKFLEFYNSM